MRSFRQAQHPALAEVRSLELVCLLELVTFYRRWASRTRSDAAYRGMCA
ncbi:hypothetical protein JOF29_007757 [Kribbella aluminosa]|uniref:Uncharacterized protein n=1 Tax=Kribbella aluminosa TaxID=416017 RepID=A0ABS4UYD7_9ACTN|nr:hypothetical protein [Kribbella aluminosa]MBP2356647.1 hypothetical protein [Kribbella aluminosa]